MSREIKFRDYELVENVMRYFTLDTYDREEHDCFGNIMQFTGLTDKNGKEVYEGDILSFEGYPDSVINFDNGSFGYEGIYGFNTLSETNLSIAEVIGNIYETPNLLQS